MKNVFSKLLAVVLVLAIAASLGVSALAAEVVRPFGGMDLDAELKEAAPGMMTQESLHTASGTEKPVGIFALQVQNGSDNNAHLTVFMLQKGGSTYLVTDTRFSNLIMDSGTTLTLKSSQNGGYTQKATAVGADDMFVYLSASGLDAFAPLSAGTSVPTQGQLYVEQVQDGSVGKGLGYLTLDFESMDVYLMEEGSNDYAIFNTSMSPSYLEIGAPVVESGTATVFAIGSSAKHPEDGNEYPVYWTFVGWELEEAYALNGSGSTGGGTQPNDDNDNGNDNDNDNDKRDDNDEDEREKEDDGNDGNEGNGGNDSKSASFDPIWLLIIAIVAVVGYMIYRSNTRNTNAAPKEGTVALDQSAPVQTGETLPLDPMGTLPLDPGFVAAPVAAQWQLRAVGGSFSGQTFPLTGTLRLGRAPQCQIVFPDGTPGISSNHCEVAIENGAVVLRDLGSSYGTFGKGGKLAPHTPCYLNSGDTFTLAQSQTFQLESAGAVQTGGTITVRDTQGREYRTGSGRMAFGRAAGNKIQFPADDKAVSSNHCVLYRENGKLYLMDVGSTNGTFFNENDRLKPNTPYRIRKGMAFFLTNRKNTFVVVED